MTDETNPLTSPEMDRIFDSLRHRRRRLILMMMREGSVDHQTDVMVRGMEESKMDLIHNHLPKLRDVGYIEWDQESGEISKGAKFEELEPLLDLIEDHADELPPGWP